MDTHLIEGIPVPSHLQIEWEHQRYVRPVYYGQKPELVAAKVIKQIPRMARGQLLLPNGGRTYCWLKTDTDEDLEPTIVAEGVVDCSLDDAYVKAIGRKRSLSQALSAYYANSLTMRGEL
jgi:hypothetical protein